MNRENTPTPLLLFIQSCPPERGWIKKGTCLAPHLSSDGFGTWKADHFSCFQMSTITIPSVSVALGRRFCVEDLEDQILHTTAAAMASYNPKVVSSRDFDDDDFDFEYFSRTYKPLSNLPTPPPSNRNSVTSSPVLGEEDDDANVDDSLLGMYTHSFYISDLIHFHTCVVRPLLINSFLDIQAQQSTSSTYIPQEPPSQAPPPLSSRPFSLAPPSPSKPSPSPSASSTHSTPNSLANSACPSH